MSMEINYREGLLVSLGLHDAKEVHVNDCRALGGAPFVSVTVSDGTSEISLYLPPDLAEELGNALCQLPALEPAPDP